MSLIYGLSYPKVFHNATGYLALKGYSIPQEYSYDVQSLGYTGYLYSIAH